ncbi:MAG: shikimate dehydrogenase [Planctomycetes bacterium]|nr:shikimate dehydrogenase [Planctomycetota bacterium]
MFFIGVTTGKSSIMKVFPKWADHLGLDAVIEGFDFAQHDEPERYREAVDFIKNDPMSLGALVTTHKLDLLKAAKDRFEYLDPYAKVLEEISSISKLDGKLCGHAKDPITSGLSLERIVDADYWQRTGGELLLLGAGGSSLALTMYLKEKADQGGDVPSRIIVTNRSEKRLNEMRDIHKSIGYDIPTSYHLCPTPDLNDKVMEQVKPYSVVVNATGLGKDAPGSPLTDAGVFPMHSIAWEFNYRGDLVFMDQAARHKESRGVRVVDGWDYFIYGWTRVVAEVFHIDIPTSGPGFEKISELARSVR